MNFFIQKKQSLPELESLMLPLINTLSARGYQLQNKAQDVGFVLNLIDFRNPAIFYRRSRAIFVISFMAVKPPVENLRALCYQTLVRTLSNMLVCFVPEGAGQNKVWITTPEAGFYQTDFSGETIYQAIRPVINAHLAIDNILQCDLPEAYWQGSELVRQMRKFGRVLNDLGLLPAPFALEQFLSPEDLQHLYNLFRVKGLSYGNLSCREAIPQLGDTTFWMTARGIDKARIGKVGQDVLLVTGLDKKTGKVKVSVPPLYDRRARVSVDAVEHFLIYDHFKDVGAIVHVHAWMAGVPASKQNFPCGTIELARDVVHLLKQTPDPAHAVVGLKNHGLTITGSNLSEIFQRIDGKLIRQIPMVA